MLLSGRNYMVAKKGCSRQVLEEYLPCIVLGIRLLPDVAWAVQQVKWLLAVRLGFWFLF